MMSRQEFDEHLMLIEDRATTLHSLQYSSWSGARGDIVRAEADLQECRDDLWKGLNGEG